MLDSLDNGRDEKDKAVNLQKQLRSDKFNAGSCIQNEESCQKGDMCPRNGGSLQGINLKLGKSYLKMIPDEKIESDLLVNVKSTERTSCLDGECCTESPQTARMTGSSCRALKHAVSTLNRLDDFNMEKIGSGFFSEVFKVTEKVSGKVMVLKMNLLRSNRPNMLKEVQLMNQLKHQNILKFKGVCVHEGQLHALTEYINGGSLEQLIQARNIDLPYLTRQKLALDIARGMEYLHGKGVFHRDLTSKNVLIKKSDDGSMMAVVGDFGLAAKIPDPKCKYRLPTVGSAYWMSPECLKGLWYNEKSDIFSFGIVLCEMIARIEADPDILPRTDNFGLDYLAFSELCGPCPPHFLKLAFSCCTFEPKSRPSFSDIIKTLERLIPEYDELLKKETDEEVKIVNAGSLNNLIDVDDSLNMAARSEEVINKCATSARDVQQRKLHHRRSLSEDVVNVVFPKHTAPSDKARCHFMTTPKQQSCEVLANPKHIGESMCQVDPHYKPRLSSEKGGRSNPFLSLAQFRGVKKIVGSQNIHLSKDSHSSIESPTSFLQNNDLFSSCFELPSPFYGITPPSSPVTGNSFDEKTKKNNCCGCYQEGCDLKDDCGKSCRIDESDGECKKSARRLFPVETSPEANKNKQYFDISSSSPKSNVCCHHLKISCANDHSKSLLLSSSSSSSSSSQSPNLFLRSVNKKSVLSRSEFPNKQQNFPPNRNLSMSLPSSPTLQRKASGESASIFAQKETEKQLVIPSDEESNEIPKKLIKSKTVPLIKKNGDFPGAKKTESKTNNKDLKKTDRDQHEDESSSSSSKNLPDNLIFQENLPNTKDVRKKNDKRTTNETDLNTLVTNRISTSSSNLLECTIDDGFLLASNVQLKRRGSCESGFFSCVGEDYGITGNEILPCEYVLQSTRQKHLDNSSATLSSSSAASSLFLLDDSLSTTTVSSLRSGSGDFNDLDDLPSRFAHHSILFSTKRPSSIYTDSSEDISSLGDLDDRNHSRYQSQQISKIVEYFERKQTGVTRNETYTKYKRNFNIEFQRNIERFDSSRADDNSKIKWDGLEGKFKKSGMGLTQKLYNNCDDGPRSKVLYDVNNFKLKKFGPQNAAENSYHHDLSKKFEGGCSISDAIRKSKIELLRKSLERGTLQVPGINPHLSSNSGVSGTPSERNSTRPLATRLMICEGAVKSKLPLFDKK